MSKPLGLTDLNRVDLNTLCENLRALKGPGVSIGTYLNQMAARMNQSAASVAATQTATITTPALTDTVNIAIKGVTYSYQLVGGDAASATTAAVAVKNALNANAAFAALYLATNAAGVLTITALRKGTGANSNTFVTTVTGAAGTAVAAGGATMAGGTGLDDILLITD